MQRIIIVDDDETLLRQDLIKTNVIIDIQANITLKSNTIYEVDKTNLLIFNGGSFIGNGSLKGYINFRADTIQIFGQSVGFVNGTVLNTPYLRPEWFGAKGDFDPLTNTAHTDDTAAINRTIEVAEQLSIKKIKFNSANYYTQTGITINHGNIWLEGSGSLLREDQFDEDKSVYVYKDTSFTSSIFCPNLATAQCIICEETVADPIYFYDLQFRAIKSINDIASATGIHFKSLITGPTWPIIFEHCYFKYFDKAFYCNSQIPYPFDFLKFTDCAFGQNNWCVYFDDYNDSRIVTWSFQFINNKCHHNTHILHIKVSKGECEVLNNNCEGTSNGLSNFALDIELDGFAHANIQHNHFESNESSLIKVVYTTGIGKAIAMHNNTDGVQDFYNHSLFENLLLDTDMKCSLNNCVLKNKISQLKPCNVMHSSQELTYACCEDVLGAHGSSYLYTAKTIKTTDICVPPDMVIYNPKNIFPVEFVDTPAGRKCMVRYFGTSSESFVNTALLLYGEETVSDNNSYLNIEIPIYYKYATPGFEQFIIKIKYDDETSEIVPIGKYELHTYYNGFYRLRLQKSLYRRVDFNKVAFSLYYRTTTNCFSDPQNAVYMGSRSYIITDTPIPLNCQINPDYDMSITGNDGEQLILKKGDQFISQGFKITCLTEGNILTNSAFILNGTGPTDSVISSILPTGSIWTDGTNTFKIIAIDGNSITSGESVTYTIDSKLSSLGNVTNVKPLLIGCGTGNATVNQLNNLSIVNYLGASSTYFSTSDNKSYILLANRTWHYYQTI